MRNVHGTESLRGTATSAHGSAICEMSSFILKQRNLTWTSLTEHECHHVLQVQPGNTLRPSNWIQFDAQRVETHTRECMVAGVNYLLMSLERAMGMEDATKIGQVQQFFYKKLQRPPGQPMAEWVDVFEKAVLDMKVEGLNVELKSMVWDLFENSNLTLERQERVGRAAGEHFLDTARKNALANLVTGSQAHGPRN